MSVVIEVAAFERSQADLQIRYDWNLADDGSNSARMSVSPSLRLSEAFSPS